MPFRAFRIEKSIFSYAYYIVVSTAVALSLTSIILRLDKLRSKAARGCTACLGGRTVCGNGLDQTPHEWVRPTFGSSSAADTSEDNLVTPTTWATWDSRFSSRSAASVASVCCSRALL